jgi:hypothetical protein
MKPPQLNPTHWELSNIIKRATQFPWVLFYFQFFLLNSQWPNSSIFNGLNFVKPPQCTSYSSRASNGIKSMTKGHCGLGDLNMTKQTKPNHTKLPSLIEEGCQYYTTGTTIKHTHYKPEFLHVFSLFLPFYCHIKANRVLALGSSWLPASVPAERWLRSWLLWRLVHQHLRSRRLIEYWI